MHQVQRVYYLVTALSWFASVLPMAVTVLFAQSRGFSLIDVGLYTAVYSLAVVLLEVPSGVMADAFGRKRVALLSYLVSMLATTVLLFTFTLPWLLLFAVLHGLARALGSGALQAWFVDALLRADPGAELQAPLALAGTFELLALAAGTLAGGALPTLLTGLPSAPGTVLTPLATPLVTSTALTGLTLMVAALTVHEPRTARAPLEAPTAPSAHSGTSNAAPQAAPQAAAQAARLEGVAQVVKGALHLMRSNRTISVLLLVEALGGFALMGMENLWQPFFALRIGAAPDRTWLFGVVLAGCFGAGMVGNLAAIPATRWLRHRYARVASLYRALQAVALMALAAQQSALPAGLLFWLTYFAMSGGFSPLATLLNLEVPSSRRSVMLSVQSMSGFAGSFVGSLVLGLVAERASIGLAWAVAAGVLGVSTLLLARLDRAHAQSDIKI